MFDYLGKEITVGDYIVYARLFGQSASLNTAKVIEIKNNKLKCLGIDSGYYIDKITGKPEVGIHLMSKPIYLAFSNRLIVINKEQLTEEVLNILG